MTRHISKHQTTKNAIDRQCTERGQLYSANYYQLQFLECRLQKYIDLNGVNTLLQTRGWAKDGKPQVAFVFVVLFLMFKILSWIKQIHKKLIRSSLDPTFCVILVCGPLQLMCIYCFLVKQQDWMSPLYKKYQVIIIIIIIIIIIMIIIIIIIII